VSEYLSPENFISGFGKTAGNYLSPEFLEFLGAELLRCGKALQTVAPALEHENREVKEQAHLAATAQFFYALGLLYARGLIIPPEVPGTSSRAEEPSAVTACEVFGESLAGCGKLICSVLFFLFFIFRDVERSDFRCFGRSLTPGSAGHRSATTYTAGTATVRLRMRTRL
jgi:hypothetical protein